MCSSDLGYHQKAESYLDSLLINHGLENRKERLIEACHTFSRELFRARAYSPSESLVKKIQDTLLEQLGDEEKDLESLITQIDNNSRGFLFQSLIYSSMSLVKFDSNKANNEVHPKFYAFAKQAQRLIFPPDRALNLIVDRISPRQGQAPSAEVLRNILEVREALHRSPVSLEAIEEEIGRAHV